MLGGHGLFTWGETQRECYLNTITMIDQIGQFIARHGDAHGPQASAAKRCPLVQSAGTWRRRSHLIFAVG